MSRKTAREIAFKMIFASHFQTTDGNINEMLEPMLQDLKEGETILEEDRAYIEAVVGGVREHLESLDQKIAQHLKGWTMDRICKTDLAILRLATFEILYREDIPYKVSVNEAVELAKLFSEENSSSFVNGVLAEIISAEGIHE